jgi:hypothetical protein
MSFEDDGHACSYTRELANAAVELGIEKRQRRASDARKRQMAYNCFYRTGDDCRADADKTCEKQCGNRGAIIDHEKGVLIHARS